MSNSPFSPDAAAAIRANLVRVRERVATAAARVGRRPEDIQLIAVSKTYPAEAVAAALDGGQMHFGENRVQEAAEKFPSLRTTHSGLRLHLIGGLQTNKAADAVRLADMIESLDRPRLADAIAAAAAREGRLPALLVQVNVGDEPQKSGIPRAAADDFITACRDRFGPALVGLMCIPPAGTDPTADFAWLANRAVRHRLATISMGMSADFEIAIAQGATQVRVGSAIFGARP